MSKFVRPDDGPMMADVLGDDRFSPGVSCYVVLDQPVGKLLLESVLIDILVDKSETIMDCGRSDLYLPLGHIFGYKKCGDYLCLIRIRLIFQIRATRTFVLGCRGCQTSLGTWTWTLTLLYWLGVLFPDSDAPGWPARICSDVARPPDSEGLAGSGGLWLYKAGSYQRVAIS